MLRHYEKKQKSLLLGITTGLCLFFIVLGLRAVSYASDRETELFISGYEYIFSFRPEKAAETFKTFLAEFPDSSARDAAMFWLSKTRLSLGYYSEAEKLFRELKKNFPESPFIPFADKEMQEIIGIKKTEGNNEADTLLKQYGIEAASETDIEKNTEFTIKGKVYTAKQIFNSMFQAAVTLHKIGIKDVLWRTGNTYNDFVNELLLFEESKKVGAPFDSLTHKELSKTFRLNAEESDYLLKFMMIGSFIDLRLKKITGKESTEELTREEMELLVLYLISELR